MSIYNKALPPDPLATVPKTRKRRADHLPPERLSKRARIKQRYADLDQWEEDSEEEHSNAQEIERLRRENEALRSQLAGLTKRVKLLQDQCEHNCDRIATQDRQIRAQDEQVVQVAVAVREAFQGYQDAMRRLRRETPSSLTDSGSGGEEIQVHSAFSVSDSDSDYSV
ncbi:hypothetical protein LZ32DRAFT_659428 [Colletotrichum eremochloae]|nr:hypothetical protein LZ32DRAFT_659428 [Colletotrichum eremochloae]